MIVVSDFFQWDVRYFSLFQSKTVYIQFYQDFYEVIYFLDLNKGLQESF